MSEPIIGYINSDGLVEVEKVYYYPPREGKKSFIKIAVACREYYGGRGASANYATRFATLLAFNEVADAMQGLIPGDLVVFDHAKPNAGLPYKNGKGEMSSTPEHKVQSWFKVGHVDRGKSDDMSAPAATASAAAFAASAQVHDANGKIPVPAPAISGDFETEDVDFNDPFADQ